MKIIFSRASGRSRGMGYMHTFIVIGKALFRTRHLVGNTYLEVCSVKYVFKPYTSHRSTHQETRHQTILTWLNQHGIDDHATFLLLRACKAVIRNDCRSARTMYWANLGPWGETLPSWEYIFASWFLRFETKIWHGCFSWYYEKHEAHPFCFDFFRGSGKVKLPKNPENS